MVKAGPEHHGKIQMLGPWDTERVPLCWVSATEFCIPSLDFSRQVREKHGVNDCLLAYCTPKNKERHRAGSLPNRHLVKPEVQPSVS